MRLSRTGLASLTVGVVLTAALALTPTSPAYAWSNGGQGSGPSGQGDGYGTHDWILDQGVRIAGASGTWLDAAIARVHTDDPDYARVVNDHVMFESGDGRGAAQVTSDLYAKAVEAYKKGDRATASVDVGLLSHYVGDTSQPYHTAYAALNLDSRHALIESLVETQLYASTATVGAAKRHDWTVPRAPVMLGSIRNAVVREAAYSRQYFPALDLEMQKNPTTISSTVNSIVAKVLADDANQMADIIASIPAGRGIAPDVAMLTSSVSKPYDGPGQYETVYAHATGTDGKPIDALAVTISFPTASGVVSTARKFTNASGDASFSVVMGNLAYNTSYATSAKAVTSPGTTHEVTKTAASSFIMTPQLKTGLDGFSSTVSNHSPAVGSTLGVTSTTTNVDGLPQRGLKVTYTWPFSSGTVTTVAYTDSAGHATSSVTVPSSARGVLVRVAALTQAGGFFRNSSSTFTAT